MGNWVQAAPTRSYSGNDFKQIFCLGIHAGNLYGGTRAVDGSDPNGGYVLWFDSGSSQWLIRGLQFDPTADCITSLLSYDDGGGAYLRATVASNFHAPHTYGGALLTMDIPNLYLRCLQKYSQLQVWGATEFGGKLYVGTFDQMNLFSVGVGANWVDEVLQPYPPPAQTISTLCVYNGKLYGATAVDGLLFEFNDALNTWVQKAPKLGDPGGIYKLLVYDNGSGNKLYGITSKGSLYQWNDSNAWVEKAYPLTFLWRACIHDGYIYAGQAVVGSGLYRWNKTNSWEQVAGSFGSETDVFDVISWNGNLYGGTGPTGKLLRFDPTSALFIVVPSLPTVEALGNPVVETTTTPRRGSGPEVYEGGDIRLEYDVNKQYLELVLEDRDVERDGGFETAVLITLATDKRADEGDPLPDEGGYKGGWWGDSLPVVPDYKMGTKLWLLQRSKTTSEIPARAEEYLRDGFQWMIDDGIVENVGVAVTKVISENQPILSIQLTFQRPEGQTIFFKFFYNWETQILRRQ